MNQFKRFGAKCKVLILITALFGIGVAPLVTGVASASIGSQPSSGLLGLGSLESINLQSSGLIEHDSLTTGNTNYWTFYGDAVAENAPYAYSENSNGLTIGVQAAQEGLWGGYFAESPHTNGQVFHATITLPYTTIPDPNGYFNVGFYVQTSAPTINYIACAAGVSSGGYYWEVVLATGTSVEATNIQTLYYQWMNNQPLTQECQIITNGVNSLTVYLGGNLVYTSNSLSLNMPEPMNTYLEVETSSATQMFYGSFTNYYATTTSLVTVTGLLPDSTVEIVAPSGNVLASAQTGSGTTATLPIGMYSMPLNANIEEFALSTGIEIASTPSPVSIWGGDAYTVSLL